MAKYKLQLEEDYDFELIGICSSHADYRLTWGINQVLNIRLAKGEDFSIRSKKGEIDLYSFYEFYDEDEHIEYYLIKNTSNNYRLLIPEKDQIDYFLIIRNHIGESSEEILSRIKSSESVLTAFVFDAEELKSKANLIF